MIKLKGNILVITGKDEKLLKKQAKIVNMPPKKFLLEMLKTLEEKYQSFGDDIFMEKLK